MAEVQGADLFEKLEKGEIDVAGAVALRAEVNLSPELRRKVEEFVQDLDTSLQTSRSPAKKTETTFKLGVGLYAVRRDQDAADCLAEVKSEPVAARLLARSLAALGRFKNAEAVLKGISSKQEEIDIEVDLIDLSRRSGDTTDAVKSVDKLLKKYGERADLHYQKGLCLEDTRDYEGAMDEFEKAQELDSGCAEAAFRLAFLHDQQCDEDEAIKYYRRCTYHGNFHVDALLNLGVIYEDRGEFHEAHRCYLAVLSAYPNHEKATMYLKDVNESFYMRVDEDLLKRPDGRMRLLETPISEFELSARSRNCLESMGITSLGELAAKTESELMTHRNFGETSLAEIKQLLRSKALELGQPLPKLPPSSMPRLPGADGDLLNKNLADIDMSARARKCVETLHLTTLGDLADKTEKELMQCRNVGVTTVEELKKKLSIFGLALRKDA